MPNRPSKKQLILDYAQGRGLERIGGKEIRAIETELRRRLGPDGKTGGSYIANVLRQAGARVDFNDRFVDPLMEEPYAARLTGLLEFADLKRAEASLEKLDAAYREYREVADRVGTCFVRSLVLKGKERAQSLAANSRVSREKRQEKEEISCWFKVWLEVPDLFFDWLTLRKESEEFQRLFAHRDGHSR